MWAKRYLSLDASRPAWAYALDAIIANHTTKSAKAARPRTKINVFLQDWNANTTTRSGLPVYARNLLNTAKKHNLSLGAIKMDKNLKRKLPLWYHLGADKHLKKLNNTTISDCLREKHGVTTIASLQRALRGEGGCDAPIYGQESVRDNCTCTTCQDLRGRGCKHPRRCRQAADRLLHFILPKWNPEDATPGDGLTLTRRRKRRNQDMLETSEGDFVFDPSVTEKGELSEAFRVFVEEDTTRHPPALRPARGRVVHQGKPPVQLKTSSTVFNALRAWKSAQEQMVSAQLAQDKSATLKKR
ncbi:hypothetical protein FOMPIDRAFT_1137360 [Fomitopsis schrenkii]|uniref:Uncharacterized protein n=1 Tax=Fomitopsis schrenkii TaxID=2126942 RepID=S8DGV2_FOMSC|nr:hypothetical protein FOMPIDRAFT_1137360 [Fomitopsis schrenkii]